MKILGIDPGLNLCGYGLLQADRCGERLLEAGVIRTDASRSLEERLVQIASDFASLMERFEPEIVAVEDLYAHYQHPRTAILMGHARGVILQQAAAAGAAVKSFSATRIKKSLTGSGRAGKAQIQRAIRTLLGLAAVPEPPDVADAIAAALCCANEQNRVR
jgi:crossover junction endodeoxyribonuclease RuvC